MEKLRILNKQAEDLRKQELLEQMQKQEEKLKIQEQAKKKEHEQKIKEEQEQEYQRKIIHKEKLTTMSKQKQDQVLNKIQAKEIMVEEVQRRKLEEIERRKQEELEKRIQKEQDLKKNNELKEKEKILLLKKIKDSDEKFYKQKLDQENMKKQVVQIKDQLNQRKKEILDEIKALKTQHRQNTLDDNKSNYSAIMDNRRFNQFSDNADLKMSVSPRSINRNNGKRFKNFQSRQKLDSLNKDSQNHLVSKSIDKINLSLQLSEQKHLQTEQTIDQTQVFVNESAVEYGIQPHAQQKKKKLSVNESIDQLDEESRKVSSVSVGERKDHKMPKKVLRKFDYNKVFSIYLTPKALLKLKSQAKSKNKNLESYYYNENIKKSPVNNNNKSEDLIDIMDEHNYSLNTVTHDEDQIKRDSIISEPRVTIQHKPKIKKTQPSQVDQFHGRKSSQKPSNSQSKVQLGSKLNKTNNESVIIDIIENNRKQKDIKPIFSERKTMAAQSQ